MLVELGNGTSQPRRFFFDLGNGSVDHAIALQAVGRRTEIYELDEWGVVRRAPRLLPSASREALMPRS
jgi:hypothetical protein